MVSLFTVLYGLNELLVSLKSLWKYHLSSLGYRFSNVYHLSLMPKLNSNSYTIYNNESADKNTVYRIFNIYNI